MADEVLLPLKKGGGCAVPNLGRRGYDKLTEADKVTIIRGYKNGAYIKDLPEALNITKRAIQRVLREAGIYTMRKNRYTLNEHWFDIVDTEPKAYFLGLLYADGYVGNNNQIVLSQCEDNKDLVYAFAKAIEYTGEIRAVPPSRGKFGHQLEYRVGFSSAIMARALRRLGLFQAKSGKLTNLPHLPPELMRHFVRGYFDGNGSIYFHLSKSRYKDKVYTYLKATFSLIGTKQFLTALLKFVPVTSGSFHPSKADNLYYLVIHGKNDLQQLFLYMYDGASVFLKRKYDKWQQYLVPTGE